MAVTDSATCNAVTEPGNPCDPRESENINKCPFLSVDYTCRHVASQYAKVTRETDTESALSGKQNGCAIKSTFRRSVRNPSLLPANPFAPTALPPMPAAVHSTSNKVDFS